MDHRLVGSKWSAFEDFAAAEIVSTRLSESNEINVVMAASATRLKGVITVTNRDCWWGEKGATNQ